MARLIFSKKKKKKKILSSAAIVISALRVNYVPPPKGRGSYWFWCWSHLHWHDTFLSTQYLVDGWLDSFQIFEDIQLGHNKEVIRLWSPWPNFQGHSSRKTENSVRGQILFSLKALLLVYCFLPTADYRLVLVRSNEIWWPWNVQQYGIKTIDFVWGLIARWNKILAEDNLTLVLLSPDMPYLAV